MSTPTRILLVDDHSLFRESLVRLLESEMDLSVVAHCASVSAAMEALRRSIIDIVLLDYDLGEERGTDLLQEMKTLNNPARILMVTAGMSDRITLDVMNAGVNGVLNKHSKPAQLVDAIRKIAQGEMWLDSNVIRPSMPKKQDSDTSSRGILTRRQHEVLSGILDGLSNKEIAWKLAVSESSVKAVIQELFRKAGVRTRSQLVRIAIEKHATDWLTDES